MTVLVAGATGALGRELVTELGRRGVKVRALARSARSTGPPPDEIVFADLTDERADLAGACKDADTIISVAGQSTAIRRIPDRRGFHDVDYEGNKRLLEAAESAGSRRFLYVSIFNAANLQGLAYVDAHERFVELLRQSRLAHTVVRANGFFSTYRELLQLAAEGRRVPLIADGSARSNPIHEADLAVVCLNALDAGVEEVEAGGPEVLTRREEVALAFSAVGGVPRTRSLPGWIPRGMAGALRPVDPRRAAVLAFVTAINQVDMVAPSHGTQRLSDYLRCSEP